MPIGESYHHRARHFLPGSQRTRHTRQPADTMSRNRAPPHRIVIAGPKRRASTQVVPGQIRFYWRQIHPIRINKNRRLPGSFDAVRFCKNIVTRLRVIFCQVRNKASHCSRNFRQTSASHLTST